MSALARKLAVYVVTAWVAITVNFLLPRLMPGNHPAAGHPAGLRRGLE